MSVISYVHPAFSSHFRLLSRTFFVLSGVYLFFFLSAINLHFFFGVFLHFIIGANKKQIEDLKDDLEKKDEEYQRQISGRDFDDLLKESISQAKGRNAKAITALLDVEKLKESKNQKDDVAAALKALSEQEDSKMLFGEPDPKPVGNGHLIGQVTGGTQTYDDARMRAVMGLPPVQTGTKQEG